MSKKNKSGSQSSSADLQRVTSNTSSANLSPKTPAARQKDGSGSFRSDISSGQTSPEMVLGKSIENLNITKTSPGIQLPGLPFKSFKNGTLITNNGEPTLRPAMVPLPAASTISRLSAVSPSFVPITPSPKPFAKPIHNPRPIGLPTPPTPGYEKVQSLLQDLRSSPTHGYGGHAARHNQGYHVGYNGGFNPYSEGKGGYVQESHAQAQFSGDIGRYPTPPGPIGGMSRTHTPSPGPSSVHSYDSVPRGPRTTGILAVQPVRQFPTLDQRPTREFLARKDRGKKDILVTAEGITRNHVRIIERQLPNGIPYQSFHNDFDSPKYNFVEKFKAMTAGEKESFLAKNFVDILVEMKSAEEENLLAAAEPGDQLGQSLGKKGRGKNKSKAKEVKDTKEVLEVKDAKSGKDTSAEAAATTVVTKREVTSLDNLKSLGPEFASYAKRLTVTLAFPPSHNPTDLVPMTGAGPIAQLSITPPAGPAQTSSNFIILKKLVDYIHIFKNLSSLSVILRIPASQRMPFTMSQLHHVLPFYDLGFTDWDIKYLPENLSVPSKVRGWAIGQLDRERNKIIAERLRKVEEAVFDRGSVMPGISNENLDAAAVDFNNTVASTSASSAVRRSRNSRSSHASR
ncbi:hypothetical protein BKA64DRAFT_715276 [Cadophora sp. MPI-SDFR-AT-0126]|nr:hypothetical protein BKA64DRAFT_715276 [Leotiomycetes sp. MPI-SDFR-AT-0126]